MKVTFVYRGQRFHYPVDKTPMKTLYEVFTEFCQEQELEPSSFDILMRNKPLNNSQLYNPLRFSDFPPNVPFEVVQKKTPSAASVSTAAGGNAVTSSETGDSGKANIPQKRVAEEKGQSSSGSGTMVKVAFQLPKGRLIRTIDTSRTFVDALKELQEEGHIPEVVDLETAKLVFLRRTFQGDDLEKRFSDIGIKPGVSASFRVTYEHVATESYEQTTTAETTKAEKESNNVDDVNMTGQLAGKGSKSIDDTSMEDQLSVESISDKIKKALERIQKDSFSSDTIKSLEILLKILDNVVAKPLNDKVRSLKLDNPKVGDYITRFQGAIEILQLAGFHQSENPQMGMTLTLSPENEDVDNIMAIRKTIEEFARREFEDIRIPQPPDVESYRRIKEQGVEASQHFDPFQSNVTRFQPLPGKSDDKDQLTDSDRAAQNAREKLNSLRQSLQFSKDNPPPRETVMFEKNMAPKLQSNEGSTQGGPSESALLFGYQKRREKEISGGDTLRTAAMRQAENLKKQKIYGWTVIRVFFPDGCILQGIFSPQETVADVRNWIEETCSQGKQLLPAFELVVSPPRQVLSEDSTLEELGLQPAAVILFSPKDKNSRQVDTQSLVSPGLLATEDYVPPRFAKGQSIESGETPSVDSEQGASSASMSSRQRDTGQASGSSKGKPAWLKI